MSRSDGRAGGGGVEGEGERGRVIEYSSFAKGGG